jgi:hypothetical protein
VWPGKWVLTFFKNIIPPPAELKMEAVCFSETLVPTYPGDHNRILQYYENLKLHVSHPRRLLPPKKNNKKKTCTEHCNEMTK